MRKFDDKEILDSVERLPTFKGWKKGEYDIWVRSSADAFDQFDDKAFTYHCSKDGERPAFFMSRSGTTNAGSYGLKHFDEYNHEGCAVLKADVIVYGSHIYGLHHGKPAYRQNKSWPYFRDNNRNNRAEEIGTVHSGVIGANIHRAGVNSTVIKNWSTACLVTANLAKFLAFLAYMKSQGNPPLNVAVLKESTISAAASTGQGLAGSDADESRSTETPAGSPSDSSEPPPIPVPPTDPQIIEQSVTEKAGEPDEITTKTAPADGRVIEKEQPVGFFEGKKQQLSAWFTAIGGTAALRQYKEDLADFGLPITFLKYAIFAVLIGFAGWFLYGGVMHLWSYVSKRWLTASLVAANTTPTNTVMVATSDRLDELEKAGWTVVRRT